MRKCDLQIGTSQKVSKKKNSLMLIFGGKDIEISIFSSVLSNMSMKSKWLLF